MRILLGMSGGLDSTYTAAWLNEMGHSVDGAVLIMSQYTDTKSAYLAAKEAGISIVTIDATVDFEKYVKGNFIFEYTNARTPNPCVVCNKHVKIEQLCRYAEANGYDRVATGHYAKIYNDNGRYCVGYANDMSKDQSYMLWALTQRQLSLLYTPLGDFIKSEIREIAKDKSLTSAKAKESQEICFIPDNDYISFIEREAGAFPSGDFLDMSGNVLGSHSGIIRYTIGQRKGLGNTYGKPVYVVSINAADNTVTLSDNKDLFTKVATVGNLNYQLYEEKDGIFTLSVKIRYKANPTDCIVFVNNGIATVEFSVPQRAVTPGQSAVFYDNGKIAFGGTIL